MKECAQRIHINAFMMNGSSERWTRILRVLYFVLEFM